MYTKKTGGIHCSPVCICSFSLSGALSEALIRNPFRLLPMLQSF